MNVPAAQQIADGTGVKVGIIADGIDPNNPDLIRANGQHVVFDYRDFSGFGNGAPTDGREAFLDAGTIASQGNQTYDLSGFVNPAHPLPPGCNIKIKGIAPGASLAVLNVAGSNAGFFNSQIIQAIQWAVMHDHVNVLNESIGGNPLPDTEDDPVALADQAAVAAGVTVVASSGDAGPVQQHRLPGHRPRRHRRRRHDHLPGLPADHPVRHPAGPRRLAEQQHHRAELGRHDRVQPGTVDVVAPGDRGWSLCSSNTDAVLRLRRHRPRHQPAADLGGRRYQRLGTRDVGHRGAGHPGLRQDPSRGDAVPGAGQADHRQHGHRPRRPRRPPGRRPGQHAQGRAARRVDQRRQPAGQHAAGPQAGPEHYRQRRPAPQTFHVSVTNEGSGSQTVTPTVSGSPDDARPTTPAASP